MLTPVNKADFPAEWGKILGVGYELDGHATCTMNEAYDDWMYSWSIHFENGTLAVLAGKDATCAAIDESLFVDNTNTYYSGAVYKYDKWNICIAVDQGGLAIWKHPDGPSYKSALFSNLKKYGWNNGTNSVYTDAFSFSVEDDGAKLVVTKNGTFFGCYTVAG